MVEQSVKNWFCVCRHGGTGCPTGFVFTGMVLDCYRMSIQFCVCRHGRTVSKTGFVFAGVVEQDVQQVSEPEARPDIHHE